MMHDAVDGAVHPSSSVRTELTKELRESVQLCAKFGLPLAARWSAEFLAACRSSSSQFTDQGHANGESSTGGSLYSDQAPADEQDQLAQAKIYFDLKEFDHAAFILRSSQSEQGLFLRLFSKYLSTGRQSALQNQRLFDDRGKEATSGSLLSIVKELEGRQEPFLLYLRGSLRLKLGLNDEAKEDLINSVSLYPLNWNAWQELGKCIQSLEELLDLQDVLPAHFARRVFEIYIRAELHDPDTDALQKKLAILIAEWPDSLFLQSLKATVHYTAREFDEAATIFESILEIDPFRLEDMDTYSNILYVMDQTAKLSHLAHAAALIDQDRPETCCIIGNYYSILGEHEKSVVYFRRALKLDASYLAAWTLMGHEFVEMKNSSAAIEAYRRATEVNSKDYRAWYGLGQTYELLEMPHYALWYYQRAAHLRPMDARMWQALAQSYELLGRLEEALKCLQRSLALLPEDLQLLLRIANLQTRLGSDHEAMQSHLRALRLAEQANLPATARAPSHLFLATYELSVTGNIGMAEHWASQCASLPPGNDLERAKAIARACRSRRLGQNA